MTARLADYDQCPVPLCPQCSMAFLLSQISVVTLDLLGVTGGGSVE